jgi:hypothetical protein
MRVNPYVTCIDHHPFKIRLIYQCFQKLFPNSLVSPSTKAAVRILPIAVIGGQVSPWCAGAQNPKHSIDKLTIVTGISSPSAFTPKQIGLQKFPNIISYVVTSVRCFHYNPLGFEAVYMIDSQYANLLTTCPRAF